GCVGLPDDGCAGLVPGAGVRIGGAREAAAAFLGHAVELAEAALPGRFEVHGREVRDGAHTPDAAEWLLERLPERGYVVVASILEDKDATGILERLARAGDSLVATTSSNDRALPAAALAERGRASFASLAE